MKHINLKILMLSLTLFIKAEEVTINKQITFGDNHSTFEISSDSMYYVLSNIANKNYTKKNGAIAIIDKYGETKNLIKIGTNNNYILSSSKLQNNQFLFVGYNKENNDEWNKIYIAKTDKYFNMIWEKSYGVLNGDCKGYSIVPINENEYWILGHTKISKNGVLILKIDGDGNEKWFSYLPDLNCSFANKMIVSNKKELIISGQNSNKLFISKINQNGKLLWQYDYFDDTKYHRIYDIKNTKDGGIIAAGNSTLSENYSYDILLIKLTKNGQEEWVKTFGDKTNEVAYDIEQNDMLEYIVAGYSLIDKKNKLYNSFLIKTDSIGNKISRLNFNKKLMNHDKTSNQLYDIEIKKNDAGEEIYVGTGNIFNEENNSEIWFLKIKF
tara:strand:+ start:846 stop:1994 length:1149 start_codon:yes stop_codon:yes gene_type:complete